MLEYQKVVALMPQLTQGEFNTSNITYKSVNTPNLTNFFQQMCQRLKCIQEIIYLTKLLNQWLNNLLN